MLRRSRNSMFAKIKGKCLQGVQGYKAATVQELFQSSLILNVTAPLVFTIDSCSM